MPPSRREELIDAAMRVFYRNGFHNTGLDMILSESGISRMTLYNHFKSKDELIVAALRRRDELFRNAMMKYVESASDDPVERLLAIFDWHASWFAEDDFSGCMFINASAEYSDCDSPMRRVAADHKLEILRYIRTLCETAGISEPESTAMQLNLLIEGAIVMTHVVCRVKNNPHEAQGIAQAAKRTAAGLIQSALDSSH